MHAATVPAAKAGGAPNTAGRGGGGGPKAGAGHGDSRSPADRGCPALWGDRGPVGVRKSAIGLPVGSDQVAQRQVRRAEVVDHDQAVPLHQRGRLGGGPTGDKRFTQASHTLGLGSHAIQRRGVPLDHLADDTVEHHRAAWRSCCAMKASAWSVPAALTYIETPSSMNKALALVRQPAAASAEPNDWVSKSIGTSRTAAGTEPNPKKS